MWLMAMKTFIWKLEKYTLTTWLLFLRSRERPRRDHSRENRGGLLLSLYIFVINVPCFSKTKHSKNLSDMEKQLNMGIFCWEEWSKLSVSTWSKRILNRFSWRTTPTTTSSSLFFQDSFRNQLLIQLNCILHITWPYWANKILKCMKVTMKI